MKTTGELVSVFVNFAENTLKVTHWPDGLTTFRPQSRLEDASHSTLKYENAYQVFALNEESQLCCLDVPFQKSKDLGDERPQLRAS